MKSIELKNIVKAKKNLAYRNIEGEAFILSIEDSFLHNLNPVGTKIWEILQKKIGVEELIENIVEEFLVDFFTAKKDILEFLQELKDKELIEIDEIS